MMNIEKSDIQTLFEYAQSGKVYCQYEGVDWSYELALIQKLRDGFILRNLIAFEERLNETINEY